MFYSVLLWLCQAKPPAVTAGSVKAEKPQTRKTLAKKTHNFFEEVIKQLWDGLAWSKAFTGAHWSCHRCLNHVGHCHLQIKQILEAFFI